MTGWASTADCVTVTGSAPVPIPGVTTTGDATLALAQSIVEDHCNRTPDANGGLRTRDLTWLKKAVAYQAAWLPGQAGILHRVGVKGVSQDGVTAEYRSAADQLLAPLTQRALKNCSWMGTRSIRFGSRPPRPADGELSGVAASTFLHAGADPDSAGWSQFGSH